MRDENAFNAFLSKEFKKLLPTTYALKMSEKYHIGISDFQLTRDGRSVFFESKLLRERPGLRVQKILKHPFTGPQVTFLRSQTRAGSQCFGILGVDYLELMCVVPLDSIPDGGNWTPADWDDTARITFRYKAVAEMVDYLFAFPGVP